MRPKKTRWISCSAAERCFRPAGKPAKDLEGVVLSLDEIEAIRLVDLESLKQEEAASRMKVHRSTVSRILGSAHKKIGDALVHLKAIRVESGCCKFIRPKGSETK